MRAPAHRRGGMRRGGAPHADRKRQLVEPTSAERQSSTPRRPMSAHTRAEGGLQGGAGAGGGGDEHGGRAVLSMAHGAVQHGERAHVLYGDKAGGIGRSGGARARSLRSPLALPLGHTAQLSILRGDVLWREVLARSCTVGRARSLACTCAHACASLRTRRVRLCACLDENRQAARRAARRARSRNLNLVPVT